MVRRWWWIAIVALLVACTDANTGASQQRRVLTVAAASDVRPAFEELVVEFEEIEKVDVRFVFGSSGQLKEQILNGAPFDVFASANAQFVDDIVAGDRGDVDTQVHYASGRLAVIVRNGVALPDELGQLVSTQYARVAIANPDHAPYGVAAKQILVGAGVWGEIASRVVRGENVADAVRFVTSGNADVGIVALSLVGDLPHRALDVAFHEPLRQTAVVTSQATDPALARRFIELLQSKTAARVLEKYGFGPGAQK